MDYSRIRPTFDSHREINPSLLRIYESDSSWKWASEIIPDDKVTVNFDWRIAVRPGTPDTCGPGSGSENICAWGIKINLTTGWLKVDDSIPPAPDRLYNSVVEVTVTDNNTTPSPTTFKSAIRIHVHDSIKDAWLTPSGLNVNEGTELPDKIRFSILAEFDNHIAGPVVGDISRNYVGDLSRTPGIEWTSDSITVSFDNDVPGHRTDPG